MARSNKTMYAILGFLHVCPMSGYDIKKWTDCSVNYFWQENYGHIYPVLKKMQTERLVSAEITASENGPDRIVYTITAKGKEVFQKWLSEETEPEKYRKESLLKLFFTPPLDTASMIRQVEAMLKHHKKLLTEYSDVYAHIVAQNNAPDFSPAWIFAVRNGIYTSEAQIRWCEECLAELLREQRSDVSR